MDTEKLMEEVTGLIENLPPLPWQQAPKQCGHARCDCPLMQNYVRDAQDRTVFAVVLEGSTDWKMRRMEGDIAAVLARLVSCVPELAAALKASEEQNKATTISLRCAEASLKAATAETEPVKSANLAANKRIVELEREADRLITQRDRWEEQVGDMAASAGCEEEFSNWHDHKDCVEECVAVLKAERDAARAELAQPSACPNCTAKMRRLDRMDSAGHAAYELDKARKDAAGQNKRAQKLEQEAKTIHAELMRSTQSLAEVTNKLNAATLQIADLRTEQHAWAQRAAEHETEKLEARAELEAERRKGCSNG